MDGVISCYDNLLAESGWYAGMLKCSDDGKAVDRAAFLKWSKQFRAVAQLLRAPFVRLAAGTSASGSDPGEGLPSSSHAVSICLE